MSWLCKSCGCENSSQSNVCCNCGETNKKIILSKNNNDSVKINKSTNRHQVESNVNNSQHSMNPQNRETQRVQNSRHSVNPQNRGPQRVQSPQVHNFNRNVNTSMAENRKKTEDLILKIVLIVGSIFVIFLLIVFIVLLKRNNNDNSSMVDSSQDTNITLNTYLEEDITDIETTIYTTITNELVTTTESTTTETTIESTIPVTTVQESAVILTVAPIDATTRPIETASVIVETTPKPVDNSVGHAYSPNFVTYYNDRFMYSVKYPNNFYTSFESDNGDGCELTDGCATIRLYSRYNIDNDSSRTAHDYAVSNINQDMYYELVKDSFYIISWVENGNVMYRKVFVNDRITTLEFEYSTEYKNIYDKMITEMVLTFSVD